MTESAADNLLHDIIVEIIDLTKDDLIYSNDEFDKGYVSALHAVLLLIEGRVGSFGADKSLVGLGNFETEKWYREGKGYWKALK